MLTKFEKDEFKINNYASIIWGHLCDMPKNEVNIWEYLDEDEYFNQKTDAQKYKWLALNILKLISEETANLKKLGYKIGED